MKASATFATLALVAACTAAPADQPPPAGGECPADTLQHLLGEPEQVARNLAPQGPVRNAARLNFEIGADGRIAAITCG
jgi:hypothetical protein